MIIGKLNGVAQLAKKSKSPSKSSPKEKPKPDPHAEARMTADMGQPGMMQYYPDGTVLSGNRVIEAGDMCMQKDGVFIGWRWKLAPETIGYE